MAQNEKPIVFVVPGHFVFVKIVAILAIFGMPVIFYLAMADDRNQYVFASMSNFIHAFSWFGVIMAIGIAMLVYTHFARLTVTLNDDSLDLFWENTKKQKTIRYDEILHVKTSVNTPKIILSLKQGMPVQLPGWLIARDDFSSNSNLKDAIDRKLNSTITAD